MPEELDRHDEPPGRIQDFIFARELAEVYLLLDNVSTSANKKLIGADGTPPIDAAWIEQICQIGWPPQGSSVEQATQAAILIQARDRLNSIAAPATGATIAFTLLVSGEDKTARLREGSDDVLPWWRKALLRLAGLGGARGSSSETLPLRGWTGEPPTRFSLATMAFPNLAGRANTFKWLIRALILGLFFWLVATCLLSWNVATGNALLAQLASIEAKKVDIGSQISSAETGGRGQSTTGTSGPVPATTIAGTGPNVQAETFVPLCQRKIQSANEFKLCDQQSRIGDDESIGIANLNGWLVGWSWLEHLPHPFCSAKPAGACALARSQNEQWASTLLGVLGGAVLPIFYGLLGAGAAVVRGLSARMKDSLLAPRLLTLSLVQLALGAVIGACIGLFVAPSGTSTPANTGLLGAVPLSASALCFIAGFGVEQVFVALETLLTRVFNVSDPTKKPTA